MSIFKEPKFKMKGPVIVKPWRVKRDIPNRRLKEKGGNTVSNIRREPKRIRTEYDN